MGGIILPSSGFSTSIKKGGEDTTRQFQDTPQIFLRPFAELKQCQISISITPQCLKITQVYICNDFRLLSNEKYLNFRAKNQQVHLMPFLRRVTFWADFQTL